MRIPAPRRVWAHSVDFGIKDKKGRQIGATFWIDAGRPDPRPNPWTEPPRPRLPDGFEVGNQVTRDGQSFGAFTRRTWVLTIDEARDEVRRRHHAMVKRYAKQQRLAAAGLHATWIDPETKARVGVYDSDDEDDPAAKYDVVCEEHDTVVNVPTLRETRCSTLDFCDECRSKADS